ncbi:MAG: hypothetical protein A3D92_12820 [Bacteroidetes bacterium RIFCSPHIGHO2_02_FULL_44_7]|nr:MAG: hypothetical protein A3D92_12820 [Bacteroidetes bacterium RIFCSPHIGHO2_02_FULL_44_7]
MSNKIQLENKGSASHWITSGFNGPYCRSAMPLETEDLTQLVQNILQEFEQTPAEERERFRPVLEKWLKEIPVDLLSMDNPQKVRDFIYEMF